MTSSLATVLLVLVNLGFFLLRSAQSSKLSALAPQTGPVLEKQDATFGAVLVLVSVVVVAGVFILTIAETHRTAGAIYALRQRLERVRDGDYRVSLKLRQRDTLQDLKEPFGEMVAALRHKALAEADELDRVAEGVSTGRASPSQAAEELRGIAIRKREIGS
jgi:methyl-accepting chemotaxis protein